MKKLMLVAVMATLTLGAFAQGGEKGPFFTNKAFDNWFISAGGGVNIYAGESDRQGDGFRIAPALDVSLGKWFTPAVGARLQYAGLSAKGWASNASYPFVDGSPINGYYPEKFNVSFVHADFLWNISSAFGGYKSTRFWELIPFAGFGWARAANDKYSENELALAGGLINKFRLGNALDLNLELRGMMVNQRFDGVVGELKMEGMATASIGLTYKFNKRGFDTTPPAAVADYTPYNNRINALEGDLASAKARADQLARDLEAARKATSTVKETEYLLPDTAIFFEIGKANLTDKEIVNVKYMAEVIKKMSPSKKIKLVGNADSVTGSEGRNQLLSEQRAKAVYDVLVGAGVNPSQLEIVAQGDKKEPFDHGKPALNRVLLITE